MDNAKKFSSVDVSAELSCDSARSGHLSQSPEGGQIRGILNTVFKGRLVHVRKAFAVG